MKLEPEPSMRRQYTITLLLSVDTVAGLQFGALMTPPRALDVPMRFPGGGAVLMLYYLVTNIHLLVSAALLLVMAYLVRNHTRDDGIDDVDELMPDRSDGNGDGHDFVYDLDGSSANGFGLHPLDRDEPV